MFRLLSFAFTHIEQEQIAAVTVRLKYIYFLWLVSTICYDFEIKVPREVGLKVMTVMKAPIGNNICIIGQIKEGDLVFLLLALIFFERFLSHFLLYNVSRPPQTPFTFFYIFERLQLQGGICERGRKVVRRPTVAAATWVRHVTGGRRGRRLLGMKKR